MVRVKLVLIRVFSLVQAFLFSRLSNCLALKLKPIYFLKVFLFHYFILFFEHIKDEATVESCFCL